MKTTKFFLAALVISTVFACSKYDDLQFTDAQSTELDEPSATNVKARIVPPRGGMYCATYGNFTISTNIESGSYVKGKVEAVIEYETSEGNRSVTVLLGRGDYHGDPQSYSGWQTYTPTVCISSGNGGWLRFKKATIKLTGDGKWKFYSLSIYMANKVGNPPVLTQSSISFGRTNAIMLSNNGMRTFDTGYIGVGTVKFDGSTPPMNKM